MLEGTLTTMAQMPAVLAEGGGAAKADVANARRRDGHTELPAFAHNA